MAYLLITNMYPKNNELYRNAFIHSRVKKYMEFKPNIDITIFVLNNNMDKQHEYFFDGIKVREGNSYHLKNVISKQKPNKLLIHFIDRHMMKVINNLDSKIPLLIWVHGVEALGWYRRLFNINLKTFPKYILANMRQLFTFRSFIYNNKKSDVTFIFVSNWMKNILESDTFCKLTDYELIPNPIDNNLFKYQSKNAELRKKILLIRPFHSKKYANDIAVEAIMLLSDKTYFNDLEFNIYGEGKYFASLTDKIKHFNNVNINNRFLTHQEMASAHKENGVFLCPTRQDSQGVAMCEAMSSGLVPISSNNTAIPEFIIQKKTGILTKNAKEIASAIEFIYYNEEDFKRISTNASRHITKKCEISKVITKELELMYR